MSSVTSSTSGNLKPIQDSINSKYQHKNSSPKFHCVVPNNSFFNTNTLRILIIIVIQYTTFRIFLRFHYLVLEMLART